MFTMKSLIKLLILTLMVSPAHACRPFGSYQFAEDAQGDIWFTEGDNNAISRLAPNGKVTAHPLPTAQSEPASIALSPSGTLWFIALDTAKIGRMEPDGRIIEYAAQDGHPGNIVVDAQGDAWFTQMSGHENGHQHGSKDNIAKIGRVDAQGQIQSYPVPEGWPTSIAMDGRNRVWVTLLVPGIAPAKPKGILTRLERSGEWHIIEHWENSCPNNLTPDSRGGLVFSDHCRGILGRISTEAKYLTQALPPKTYIQQMSAAADGTLWFTGDEKGRLGRIDPQGRVSYVPRPENGDQTMAVLAASNGDILFSEYYNYNINRLKQSGEFVEHLINVDNRKQVRKVRDGEICRLEFAARIASKSAMDRQRAEEVRNGHFRPDGNGTESLVQKKCLVCHDARRLLLSRRSDWTPSINRMRSYRNIRGVEPLTKAERLRLISYFNTYYGLSDPAQ